MTDSHIHSDHEEELGLDYTFLRVLNDFNRTGNIPLGGLWERIIRAYHDKSENRPVAIGTIAHLVGMVRRKSGYEAALGQLTSMSMFYGDCNEAFISDLLKLIESELNLAVEKESTLKAAELARNGFDHHIKTYGAKDKNSREIVCMFLNFVVDKLPLLTIEAGPVVSMEYADWVYSEIDKGTSPALDLLRGIAEDLPKLEAAAGTKAAVDKALWIFAESGGETPSEMVTFVKESIPDLLMDAGIEYTFSKICWLYSSSYNSKNHDLALDVSGMILDHLPVFADECGVAGVILPVQQLYSIAKSLDVPSGFADALLEKLVEFIPNLEVEKGVDASIKLAQWVCENAPASFLRKDKALLYVQNNIYIVERECGPKDASSLVSWVKKNTTDESVLADMEECHVQINERCKKLKKPDLATTLDFWLKKNGVKLK